MSGARCGWRNCWRRCRTSGRPNQIEPEPLHRPLSYVVDPVHASGREFLAWCPKLEFARDLLDAGVDALCVNNVPKAITALCARPAVV